MNKILKKQNNSAHCVVCGLKNKFSLRTRFYELDGDILVGVCKGMFEHQSYPNRMHGGVISALLDETVGRAVQIKSPDVWGVTGDLNVRYKKPVPLDSTIKVVGKITKDGSRTFVGAGFIEDEEGNLLATATATYIKMSMDKIAGEHLGAENWFLEEGTLPDDIEIKNLNFFDTVI